ncbi:hypothetical protein DV515_00005761 [Chloebia gouldiae]|uniref:Uncharacterized protein n=1 Tax=Chloebia gouldiae TaxID=44316 RepID=A0A3L8SLS0_CHLGU|nr:hypothetical protein DV515_00005761 [Chloebia gouldiae]
MTQVLVSVMVSRQFLSSYLHVDTQNILGKKYVHIQKLDVYWCCIWLPIPVTVFQHHLSVIMFLVERD